MRPYLYTIPLFLVSFAGLASANPQASSLARMQSVRTDGESFRAQPAIVISKDAPNLTVLQELSDKDDMPLPLPRTVDADGDGIADAADNCMHTYNPRQEDADGDGHGDVCDIECKQVHLAVARDVGVGDDGIEFGLPGSRWIRTEAVSERPKLALFQFQALDLPADAVIQSAYVFFYALPTDVRAPLTIHRIAEPWDEKSAPAMTWTPEKGVFDPQPVATFYAPGGFAAADVQSLVQRWVMGQYADFGFLVAETEEGSVHYFASSEIPDIELSPMLQVCYAPPPPPPEPELCPAAGPCELPGIFSLSLGACLPQYMPDGASCRGDDLCAEAAECQSGACVTVKSVECEVGGCWSDMKCDPGTGLCGEPLSDGAECIYADGLPGACWDAVCYLPECVNGVVDAGEEGVDCGGPCAPCDGGRGD